MAVSLAWTVGTRLEAVDWYRKGIKPVWEVAGYTEGGDLLLRTVDTIESRDSWGRGTIYGSAQHFSAEGLDNLFHPL